VLFARRYETSTYLGGGGFGSVWQATDQRQAQEVALKLFKPGNHPSFAFREAQALTALGGPNVLRVHNADVYQDVPYIATELAALGTTADRVSDGRGVRPDLAILWTRHMLQGLAVCHAAGLLHRDVKPANVFLRREDLAQLGDFGLVEPLGHHGSTPVAGTPVYLPPEAYLNNEMTVASDIYMAGLTLWFLLTGDHPFSRLSLIDLPAAVTRGVTVRIRDVAPHVPRPVALVAERAVAVDPSQRFEGSGEMNSALARTQYGTLWMEVVPDAGVVRQWANPERGLVVRLTQVNARRFLVDTRHARSGNRVRPHCEQLAQGQVAVFLRRVFDAY